MAMSQNAAIESGGADRVLHDAVGGEQRDPGLLVPCPHGGL
jgi:hypothetical protein